MERDDAIQRIRTALRKRSGKAWSVKGGRGTAWGWIAISAPPARLAGGYMTEADSKELGELLDLGHPAHMQYESVPSGSHYREEYVDRAEGRKPEKCGEMYWD